MDRVEKRDATPGGPASPRSDRQILDAVRAHIAARLDQDLTLAALARRAGMSASCFSRWFRDQTGMTPHAFVLEARVARAKALLRESELPILEVALAVGFSSQSCLTVTFRRRAGITPAEYRAESSKKAKDAPRGGVRRSRGRESARRAERPAPKTASKSSSKP
jgi:AraC family transcriptional regulator